jgi:hypothetical protein
MRDDRSGLAPGKVFNAVPFASFSAPAELAPLKKAHSILNRIMNIFHDTQEAQTSSAPRQAGFLRSRLEKAKPSLMVAATASIISFNTVS